MFNFKMRNNSPPGTGGVAEGRGGSKVDPSTTPSLRDSPPVPGGELGPRLRIEH
jgi:hypothetical protein